MGWRSGQHRCKRMKIEDSLAILKNYVGCFAIPACIFTNKRLRTNVSVIGLGTESGIFEGVLSIQDLVNIVD